MAPDAIETLSARIDSPVYSTEYQLRPPFGAYIVTVGRIVTAFEDLLACLPDASHHDLTSSRLDHRWDDALLLSLERLLYSMAEHVEDCSSILQCLFPPGTKFADQEAIRLFNSDVDSYRVHVAKIVNHLKHKQGRLRSVGISREEEWNLGYFVEGPAPDGSLGPAPQVHAEGATAFSYARDIRWHFHGFYYVSFALAKAVQKAARVEMQRAVIDLGSDERFRTLASRVSGLPMIVFPNELPKDFPYVSLEADAQQTLTLTAALKTRPHGLRTIGPPMKVVSFLETDGVTSKYRMPYKS